MKLSCEEGLNNACENYQVAYTQWERSKHQDDFHSVLGTASDLYDAVMRFLVEHDIDDIFGLGK